MATTRPVLHLIDASSYIYRAFFALPPLNSPAGLPIHAVYGFTTMILKLLRDTAPSYLGAVFDAAGPTFRDDLFHAYKANRATMPEELAAQVPVVHEVVAALGIRALVEPGVEADDVIGTITDRVTAAGADVVIITGDKDLLQLVGDHVSLWDTMRDRRYDAAAVRIRFGVAPEQVVEVMGLMGDAIDNIPGVKGIGEKTATTLIQKFGTIEYVLGHLDEVEAAEGIRGAKRLAAMLREHAEMARLSRTLAVVRRDVPIDCVLEEFRYSAPATEAARTLFTRLGFLTLLQGLERTAAPVHVTVRSGTDADLAALTASARAGGRVAFACAADGAVVTAPGTAPLHVDLDAASLNELLGDSGIEKVAHDLKRDLRVLDERSVAPAFDVMVASYLLEASATHRLEDLATDLLGANLTVFRDGPEALANGASLLIPVRDALAPRLRECAMERLFYDIEMPLVAVLAAMERRGVRLNTVALAAMSREMELRLAALIEEAYTLAGGEFNIASPPQLRAVLFERLGLSQRGVRRGKTGLSTDVEVLTRLAEEHPLPAKILEYRALAKLKSTYVDALPAAVNPRTGRLHTTFNQSVTATGRLSSSDPNLQNIPIRTEEGRRIRAAFTAADGCVLIGADYSQIELRLLAHLSGDQVLCDAFQRGEDVHTRTAAEVFGVLPGTVTSDMRRAAKVINFGIIYGMGSQRLARELGISIGNAEEYIASYFKRYAGVRAFLDSTIAEARDRGYVMTIIGRRRTLPDLSSRDRAVAQAAERTAANTPIQGSAADLIKLAMIRTARRLREERIDAALILQVHDELVLEATAADCDRALAVVRHEMENALPLAVPLTVEIGVGSSWAEAHG